MARAATVRPVVAVLLASSVVALASAAHAATPISVTVSPKSVSSGHAVTIRGSGWGVIEFCKARVTLTLERSRPLSALPIATGKLRTAPAVSGTFSASWVVPRTVHSGLRTVVATQHCESGKNGAPVLIVRRAPVRVR